MNQPSACVPANNCGVYSGLILIVTMVSIQILAVSSSYWSDCVTDVITSEDICHHSGARAAALHHTIIAANLSGNQEIQPEHRAAQSQAFYLSQHLITPGHPWLAVSFLQFTHRFPSFIKQIFLKKVPQVRNYKVKTD